MAPCSCFVTARSLLCCRRVKRSRALRGRNPTRDSPADGAPRAPRWPPTASVVGGLFPAIGHQSYALKNAPAQRQGPGPFFLSRLLPPAAATAPLAERPLGSNPSANALGVEPGGMLLRLYRLPLPQVAPFGVAKACNHLLSVPALRRGQSPDAAYAHKRSLEARA